MMQQVICYEPENNLVILSSGYEAPEEEKNNRLAQYLSILVEWKNKELQHG